MEAIEAFAREGASSHEDVENNAVNELLAQCPFTSVFELVSTAAPGSDEETHILMAVSRIFSSPKGFEYLVPTEDYLVQALNSGTRKKIRDCVAKVLCKIADRGPVAEVILSSEKLRLCLLEAIANESDIGVYERSSITLVKALKQATTMTSTSSATVDGTSQQQLNAETLVSMVRSLLSEILTKIKSHENNSVVLMRYVELIVQLSICSDAVFKASIECNALDILLHVIKKSDPLLQMNALDVIEKLCHSPVHVTFLFIGGITEWLLYLMTGECPPSWVQNPSNAPDVLIAPQALRIISMMFSSSYKSIDANMETTAGIDGGAATDGEASAYVIPPQLVLRFLQAACQFGDDPSNESSNLAAFDAISHFAASSSSNTHLVLDNKELAASWLTLSSRVTTKAFVLHSVAHVISPRSTELDAPLQPPTVDSNPMFSGIPSPPPSQPLHQNQPPALSASSSGVTYEDNDDGASERLFLAFGQYNGYQGGSATMGFLLDMIKKPVSEVRHAIFDIMRACGAKGQWGLRFMTSCGGFFDFLENRHSEFNKEGMEWKFSVIEAVANNPLINHVLLNNERVEKLQLMLKEGPFYVPWQPEGPITM